MFAQQAEIMRVIIPCVYPSTYSRRFCVGGACCRYLRSVGNWVSGALLFARHEVLRGTGKLLKFRMMPVYSGEAMGPLGTWSFVSFRSGRKKGHACITRYVFTGYIYGEGGSAGRTKLPAVWGPRTNSNAVFVHGNNPPIGGQTAGTIQTCQTTSVRSMSDILPQSGASNAGAAARGRGWK